MTIILSIFGLYLLIVAFFYFRQESFLFYPQPIAHYPEVGDNTEEVAIPWAGDKVLHGWFKKAEDTPDRKLIIYFGGNAEEVSQMMQMTNQTPGWSWLLVNYPGYGYSQGDPGQQSFYQAALAIYDHVSSREDLNPDHIVLLGRSIGTAPAIFLAHERETAGLILVSPFESIREVARASFPFLPVSLLLKHPFEVREYAAAINIPMLAFYGTRDNIIAPRHSIRLADAWKGPAELIALQGYGHNDIYASNQLWEEISAFLEQLQQ